MKKVYLGLGSNMGERDNLLKEALAMIGESVGHLTDVSSLYETEPVGFDGDDFLNMAVCIETGLSPSGLIGRVLMIESQLGRIRCEKGFLPRPIDIDVLLIDNEIIDSEPLIVPHPRMHQRRFVLEPLNEIAPDMIHPVIGKTINEILLECSDKSRVTKYSLKPDKS